MTNETRETIAKMFVPTLVLTTIAVFAYTTSERNERRKDRQREIQSCVTNSNRRLATYIFSKEFEMQEFERILDEECKFLNIVRSQK